MSLERFKQLGLLGVGILALIGLLRLRSCVREIGTSPAGNSAAHSPLSPKDREVVSYNSTTHELTLETRTGEKTVYSRDPVIHVQKNGAVKIDRKLYGLEFSPFFGMGYGGGSRLHLGASGFYLWRFDLNAHLAIALSKNTPGTIVPVTSISYNFWRNSSVFVGADPVRLLFQKTPEYHAGLFVRF